MKNPMDELLDFELMRRHFMDDEDLIAHIARSYLQTASEMIADIDCAIEGDQPEALQQAAHKLCGSIGSFYARQIQQDLLQLEAMGKSGEMAGAAALFVNTHQKLMKMHALLETELRRRQ